MRLLIALGDISIGDIIDLEAVVKERNSKLEIEIWL